MPVRATRAAAFLRGPDPLLPSCVAHGLDAALRLAAGGGGVSRARPGERVRAAWIQPARAAEGPGRVARPAQRPAPRGEPAPGPGDRGPAERPGGHRARRTRGAGPREARRDRHPPRMSPSRTSLPRPVRWLFRSVGPVSVVAVGWLLSQGRFRGVADPRWDEVAAAAGLVAGLCVAGVRRALQIPTGARLRLGDDLELGAPLVAAAYMVVGLAGPDVHPLVYVVMAGLVGFFDAVPAAMLLALALGFEALLTLRSGWVPFGTHAAFLVLFAAIYRVVLNARLA